jgi:threonylcarbamoyladenosine tRNA methylthiotransferase MtaB
MKYSVITFGCRVNQADSIGFEEDLRAAGAVAAAPADADLVIVNTCSVTATSDQGARQTIRRLARENPAARIVVTGCYATRRPDELAALPNVTQVIANDDKAMLVPLVRRHELMLHDPRAAALDERGRDDEASADRFGAGAGEGACGAGIEPGVAGRTAFTLRVQTGCGEPCSYCIIPETRGAPRSVPLDQILRELRRIIDAGFKEIALTGVHLGSYGRDLTPPSSLIDLLRAIAVCGARFGFSADGPDAAIDRARLAGTNARDRQPNVLFRISSLEPMDCTPEIVDLVASSPFFAPHLHLPLQHASDRVLESMRRPYTLEQYAALVNDIRARVPSASIGSDIIVGFPGERDEDFAQLVSYLSRSPLTHLHVFPYSDRPGTDASRMKDKVPGATIRERARLVRETGQRLSAAFRDAQIGTVHRALTLEDGSLVVTDNYLKLRIAPGRGRNEWVRVRVASHHDGELLSGRFPLALHNELSAGGADVASAALPH